MIGIYKITSPSGKVYIGQSVDIEKRWDQYKKINCKSQPKLYNSFKKHGVESHIFDIITTCEIEDLNRLERYYQELYNSVENGLNCVYVDEINGTFLHTEETRRKISEAHKGRTSHNKGKKMSEETKRKMSEARKGFKYTEEQKKKMGERRRGNTVTEETRLKISQSLKLSEANKGKNNHSYTEMKAISPEGKVYINGITNLSKELKMGNDTLRKILKGGYSKKWKDWTFEYVEKNKFG